MGLNAERKLGLVRMLCCLLLSTIYMAWCVWKCAESGTGDLCCTRQGTCPGQGRNLEKSVGVRYLNTFKDPIYLQCGFAAALTTEAVLITSSWWRCSFAGWRSLCHQSYTNSADRTYCRVMSTLGFCWQLHCLHQWLSNFFGHAPFNLQNIAGQILL